MHYTTFFGDKSKKITLINFFKEEKKNNTILHDIQIWLIKPIFTVFFSRII